MKPEDHPSISNPGITLESNQKPELDLVKVPDTKTSPAHHPRPVNHVHPEDPHQPPTKRKRQHTDLDHPTDGAPDDPTDPSAATGAPSTDSDEVVIVSETAARAATLPPGAPPRPAAARAPRMPRARLEDDPPLRALRASVAAQRAVVRERHRLLTEATAELTDLERRAAARVAHLRRAADLAFDWNAPAFPWAPVLARELHGIFNIPAFRPLQREALNATLMARDVFAILPTGAGKSLIYQLAAVVDRGVTVVVTPLISLSVDQKRALRRLRIRAESLDSTTEKSALATIYDYILPRPGPNKQKGSSKKRKKIIENRRKQEKRKGNWVRDDMEPSIVFVTPEQIAKNKKLMSRLELMYEGGHLSRIVIDEAHCCSTWGHDFRADYRRLGILKAQCPNTPLLALSATCCPETTADVCKTLGVPNAVIFRGSIDRPNLFYEVRKKKDDEEGVISDIAEMLLGEFKDQCGIIYVLSRKEAEVYSETLNSMGIQSGCYHGDMSHNDRSAIHEDWQNGECLVAVATIAFGLGIDNQMVRFVIHATMATSIDGYYQESGRAGRDGKPAKCIVLHRAKDFARLSAFVAGNGDGRVRKLYDMYRYCSGRTIGEDVGNISRCRRAVIAAAFNETPPPRNECQQTSCCDLCAAGDEHKLELLDVTPLAESIVAVVLHMSTTYPNEKATLLNIANIWTNTGLKGKRMRGREPPLDRRVSLEARLEILIGLVLEGALEEYYRHSSYAVNAYVSIGNDVLCESNRFKVLLSKKDSQILSQVMASKAEM